MAILYAPASRQPSLAGFLLPYTQPWDQGDLQGPFIYDTLGPERDGTCPKSHSTDEDLGMRCRPPVPHLHLSIKLFHASPSLPHLLATDPQQTQPCSPPTPKRCSHSDQVTPELKMPAIWKKNRVGTITHTTQDEFQVDQRCKCKIKQENIKYQYQRKTWENGFISLDKERPF